MLNGFVEHATIILIKSNSTMCYSKRMGFPHKPSFFDLDELECRLLASRIAFQNFMEAPRGRQFKIHGNIVNLPADISNTVSVLQCLPNQTAVIEVYLKRRLQYKTNY